MTQNWFKQEKKEFLKGVPKRDGSGGGLRLNRGRGGCVKTREVGKGAYRNIRNLLFGAGAILVGTKLLKDLS